LATRGSSFEFASRGSTPTAPSSPAHNCCPVRDFPSSLRSGSSLTSGSPVFEPLPQGRFDPMRTDTTSIGQRTSDDPGRRFRPEGSINFSIPIASGGCPSCFDRKGGALRGPPEPFWDSNEDLSLPCRFGLIRVDQRSHQAGTGLGPSHRRRTVWVFDAFVTVEWGCWAFRVGQPNQVPRLRYCLLAACRVLAGIIWSLLPRACSSGG
jgi:hypothetical protein